VVPKEIVSQKVFILGAVRKEGPVPIQSAMTVLQALNAAGGLTDYAKKKKIYILRTENGKQQRLPFDYQAVIRGERPEQNILVRPEDTIVVP
jgi:polysaccharide export outer membrane protein